MAPLKTALHTLQSTLNTSTPPVDPSLTASTLSIALNSVPEMLAISASPSPVTSFLDPSTSYDIPSDDGTSDSTTNGLPSDIPVSSTVYNAADYHWVRLDQLTQQQQQWEAMSRAYEQHVAVFWCMVSLVLLLVLYSVWGIVVARRERVRGLGKGNGQGRDVEMVVEMVVVGAGEVVKEEKV